MIDITSRKPYKVWTSPRRGLFSEPTLQVLYEGRVVRTVTGIDESDARELQFLLNTAYQLGLSDGFVEGKHAALPGSAHDLVVVEKKL